MWRTPLAREPQMDLCLAERPRGRQETGYACILVTGVEVEPMTEKQEPTETPEDRAEAAARDLADRGRPVTARAVREAAGVRMTVAADAARAWKEATAERNNLEIPEMPSDVSGRLAAIWADAYRAAHGTVSQERDHLAAEVANLREEVEALTDTVSEVEAERDAESDRARALESKRATAAQSRDEALSRAARAEEQIAAVSAERDRLATQITALIERIPATAEGE